SGNFIEVYNRSLVAYAPADNPEVAIAVITPQSELPTKSNTISLDIGHRALQAYFDLKQNQNNQKDSDEIADIVNDTLENESLNGETGSEQTDTTLETTE
ncbi:MAG: hypothetical protein ACRCST_12060, partial [Turicibacter sp.]